MRWTVLADRIPSLLETVLSRIRRARPRPAAAASAGGPYRDSPVPSEPLGRQITPTFGVEWARYRRLRKIVLVLVAGLLPGLLLLAPRLAKWTGTDAARDLFVLGWGFCFAVSAIRLSLFSCPRCRQCFRHPRWWGPWAHKSCQACRLPLFALVDPDAPSMLDAKSASCDEGRLHRAEIAGDRSLIIRCSVTPSCRDGSECPSAA